MKRIIMALAVLTGVAAFADPVARVTKVGEDPVEYNDLRTAILQCQDNVNDKLDLLCDIDLTGVNWEPIYFMGKFDGQGHKISNLSITSTSNETGFFGKFGGGTYLNYPTLKNLTFENATVSAPGKEKVGVVAGYLIGIVSNVTVRGTINVDASKWVGAIAGYAYGHVVDCEVDGGDATVSSLAKNASNGYEVGGIAGVLCDGNEWIVNCRVKNISLYAAKYACGGITGRVIGNSHVIGCSVENVLINGNDAENMSGKIVGESITAPTDAEGHPTMRYYINNAASDTQVESTLSQLYGVSATNMSWRTIIGWDVDVELGEHVSNTWFKAGTYQVYGADIAESHIVVPDGLQMVQLNQRDGSVVVQVAETPVNLANVYIDCDYSQANISGLERYALVKVGDTVSFSVAAKSGYKVGSVSFNGVNATGVDGVYSYTVTADDVDATVEGGARGVTVKVQAAALTDVVVLTIPYVDGLGKPVATYVDGDGVTQTPEVTKNATTGDWEVTVPVNADVTITYPNPELGKKASPATSEVKAEDPDGDGKVTMTNVPTAVDDLIEVTIPNVEGLGKPVVTYVDGNGVTQTPTVTADATTGDWVVTVPNGAELTITYPNPVDGKKADPEETNLTVKDEDGDGKETVDEDKLPKAVNASEEGTPVMISAIELIEDGSSLKTRLTVENLIAGGVYYYRASTDLLTLKSATSVKITEAPTADKLIFSVDRSASDTKCFYEVLVK